MHFLCNSLIINGGFFTTISGTYGKTAKIDIFIFCARVRTYASARMRACKYILGAFQKMETATNNRQLNLGNDISVEPKRNLNSEAREILNYIKQLGQLIQLGSRARLLRSSGA